MRRILAALCCRRVSCPDNSLASARFGAHWPGDKGYIAPNSRPFLVLEAVFAVAQVLERHSLHVWPSLQIAASRGRVPRGFSAGLPIEIAALSRGARGFDFSSTLFLLLTTVVGLLHLEQLGHV